MLGRVAWSREIGRRQRHPRGAQALLKFAVERVANRLMIESNGGQQTMGCALLRSGDREQEMLRLERGRPVLAGLVPCFVDDRAKVLVECDHLHRLLSSTPAAMSRLTCFLWTAWRVIPSASATSGQLHPARIACSTAASSS